MIWRKSRSKSRSKPTEIGSDPFHPFHEEKWIHWPRAPNSRTKPSLKCPLNYATAQKLELFRAVSEDSFGILSFLWKFSFGNKISKLTPSDKHISKHVNEVINLYIRQSKIFKKSGHDSIQLGIRIFGGIFTFSSAGLFFESAGKSLFRSDVWSWGNLEKLMISKEILSACTFLLLYYYCTFVHLYRYSNNNSHVRKNVK